MAFVDGDARHPDPERTCSVIAPQRREGRDETLLGDVERGIGIPDMAADETVHGLAVASHQFAIGALPAGERQRGQFAVRSEEHTSELQSLMRISYAVFCLKKKKKQQQTK